MNYDKIILELLSRVQILEEEVSELKTTYTATPGNDAENSEDEVTRAQARMLAMEKLQEHFPNSVIEKANRPEGSGIRVYRNKNDKEPVLIKFFHSKVYKQGSEENSWYVVRLDNIVDVVDFCLFSMLTSTGEYHYFIFSIDELTQYYETNRDNENNKLHLYLRIEGNKAFEIRENKVDVTPYWNNWDALKTK